MSIQSQTKDQKPKWVSAFNVDEGTWTRIFTESSSNHVSPLEMALESNVLDALQVLEWDRDQSGIAALKEAFFNKEAPLHLFKNFDYNRCREKGCMPVAEWNGNVYWAKLSSEPTGFEKEIPQALWFLAPWSGMKKWFEVWQGAFTHIKPSNEGAVKPLETELELSPNWVDALSQISPIGDMETQIYTPAKVSETQNPSEINNVSSISAVKEIQTLPLDQFETRLKHETNQEALARTLIGLWQNHFDQVMILLSQGDQLLLWSRNHKWGSNFGPNEKISLTSPSIFKIVNDSGKPYHGYMAPSAANDTFFKLANAGKYPEHATVIPIAIDDRVVSMLLGTCSKEKSQSLNLEKLEYEGKTFAESLLRLMPHHKQAS